MGSSWVGSDGVPKPRDPVEDEEISGWRPFRCDAQPWRDALWIQPGGDIDYATVHHVETAFAQFLDAGFSLIVIDLRKVTFVDSSGLRALIQARRAADDRMIGFCVAPGPPGVQRLFEVTGTAALFPAPGVGTDWPPQA
jgi:anti-anti-sigma factor